MTARLLSSFNAFDGYSQKILNKYAGGRQLGDLQSKNPACHPELLSPPVTFSYDWDLDLPSARRTELSKRKSVKQIIHEEQSLIHSTIRLVTSAPSTTGPVAHTSIRPFSCNDAQTGKCIHSKGFHKNSEEGYMIIKFKKPRSQASSRGASSARREKWSNEVEKLPLLHLLKKEESYAHTGGTLSASDFSGWCTFSTNGEGDDVYNIPESTGKRIAQQLQHGNGVRVGTNGSCRGTEDLSSTMDSLTHHNLPKEIPFQQPQVVPLKIEDEFEKETNKILDAQSEKIFIPPLIVSETHPVVFHKDTVPQFFPSQSTTRAHNYRLSLKIPSDKGTKEINRNDRWGGADPIASKAEIKRYHNEPLRLKVKQIRRPSGKQKINVHILLADGTTSKALEFKQPIENLPVNHSGIIEKGAQFNKVPVPRTAASYSRSTFKTDVGAVKNGMNPIKAVECDTFPTSLVKVATVPSGKAPNNVPTFYNKNRAVKQEAKKDFIALSKSLPLQKPNAGSIANKPQADLEGKSVDPSSEKPEKSEPEDTIPPETHLMQSRLSSHAEQRPMTSNSDIKASQSLPNDKLPMESSAAPNGSEEISSEPPKSEEFPAVISPSSMGEDFEHSPPQLPQEPPKSLVKAQPSSKIISPIISIPTAENEAQSVSEWEVNSESGDMLKEEDGLDTSTPKCQQSHTPEEDGFTTVQEEKET
ncbi:uncharacterized protein LOC120515132 [Polypterus senegalus]|uniref:uncharacterized protein LOC120515132 n=1 Tax=Polypterus senegalus TaxID=55291 RepID=UPI001964ED91|nr:uncharacterized protein LOC120515132 [Polypterus senegalus]XP_039591801.1 uncharacterized protein LOC120515132 [Polypterus senegalus]XP_039591802.1 uncharacterized protein LOC120515132 [Polypterus senegalus]